MLPATAPLFLSLQRSPALLQDGREHPLGRKDAALLAVLALDRSASRDTLAAMLWPQADAATARASLRQRRFRLARLAGVPVIEGSEHLRLAPGLLHGGTHPDALLAQLGNDALDGDLLEGCAFDDCPDVERWLLSARERWRVLRGQALARAASAHEDAGRLAQALELTRRLALDEPLSDHVHRRWMRLHHRRGDLNAALEVYRAFAERLAAELGELPDDETATLAASLRLGELPQPRPVPPVLARPPRVVGREAQWQALAAAWAARQPVLLEGAPGIGKSRLLGDVVATLDAAPLLLHALPGDAARPYALLVRLLGQLWLADSARRPGGHLSLPGWARDELATLLPALGRPATPRVDPLRLQQAVVVGLRDAGLALVAVDDAQQADAATLELLPALQGPGLPVWWLAARSAEIPAALEPWLQGSSPVLRVVLTPLGEADLHALLTDLSLPAFDAGEWALALKRYTGGLPLFVLETLRALHAQPDTRLAELPPTMRVTQAVRQRLERLPEAARQLARAAAVWQAPLSIDDAAALVPLSVDGALQAFAALESAQWVDAAGRLHDLVAAALRETLAAAERRWWHDRTAARLEQRDASAAVVATHYEAAGRDAEAAVRFEAAALAARRAARPAEDHAFHERAAAAWQRAGRPERAFAAWVEGVAPCLHSAGSAQALARARQLLANAATPHQRMHALAAIAHTTGGDGDHIGAVGPAREAWQLAQAVGSDDERLMTVQVLANQLAYTEAVDEALALLTQQRPLAERVGGARLQLFLNALSQVLHRRSELTACAQVIRDSLALIVADGNWREALTVGGNLALVLGNLGRYLEAAAVLRRVRRWRARLGEAEGTMAAGLELKSGHVLLGLGLLGSARTAYGRAREGFARHNASDGWIVSCDHWLAFTHLLAGDAAAAGRCLRPFSAPQPLFMRVRRGMLQAQVDAALGDNPAAALARVHADLAGSSDAAAHAMVAVEAAGIDGGLHDAPRLAHAAAQARACEQHALALRAEWWRVQALGRAGQPQAAATLARQLLDSDAWPSLMLPSEWLSIAAAAVAASGDPAQRALARSLAARARAARARTRQDLAAHAGPEGDGDGVGAGAVMAPRPPTPAAAPGPARA